MCMCIDEVPRYWCESGEVTISIRVLGKVEVGLGHSYICRHLEPV